MPHIVLQKRNERRELEQVGVVHTCCNTHGSALFAVMDLIMSGEPVEVGDFIEINMGTAFRESETGLILPVTQVSHTITVDEEMMDRAYSELAEAGMFNHSLLQN